MADTVELDWTSEGVPRSARFADTYFARGDGRAETRHVFLAGNGLPARWQAPGAAAGFTIAELGFGTGLNFLETWRQWRASAPAGARLTYVGFERWPLDAAAMARALAPWPDLAALAPPLLGAWDPRAPVQSLALEPAVEVTVIAGDARETVPAWAGAADAWYLDGFAPAHNPEMWSAPLLAAVFGHTRPGGSFATYTAAGWVRRNLTQAGFEVRRLAGYAGKRHMTVGRKGPHGSGTNGLPCVPAKSNLIL